MIAIHARPSPVCAPILVISWLLLSGLHQAMAQESAGHSAPWPTLWTDAALSRPHEDGTAVASTLEIAATQSRSPAPTVSPLGSDPGTPQRFASVDVRLWTRSGRASFGAGVGTLDYLVPLDHGRAGGPMAVLGAVPIVSFGVRYRLSDQQLLFADAYRARSLGTHPATALFTTHIGMAWTPSRSKFGFERGTFGLRLDSGSRLSLKVRHGKPVLYLRAQF